jgi:hypothetical protein
LTTAHAEYKKVKSAQQALTSQTPCAIEDKQTRVMTAQVGRGNCFRNSDMFGSYYKDVNNGYTQHKECLRMKRLLLICTLGLLPALANAEFAINSKGEKVELKNNETSTIVKLSDDYVLDGKYYDVTLKDGKSQDVIVNVLTFVDQKDGKKLTRDQALLGIKMTEIPILDGLKNRHSYVPVKVYIYQIGNSVNITIEYFAKIYGAKKIGSNSKDFIIDQNGEIHIVQE